MDRNWWRQHPWVQRAALLGFGCLVALLCAEVLLRISGVEFGEVYNETDPVRGWRLTAGSRSAAPTGIISVNTLGFRGPEFPPQKPAGQRRIFALGCSCTFGCAVGDTRTYAGHWQGLLDGEDTTPGAWAVINAGVSGYCTRQGLMWLRSDIVRYAPDVLTVYYGWNDHWPETSIKQRLLGEALSFRLGHLLHQWRFGQSLSRLHLLVREAMLRPEPEPAPAPPAAAPAGTTRTPPVAYPLATGADSMAAVIDATRQYRVPLDEYAANLRAFVAFGREQGVAVLLATAPADFTYLPQHRVFPPHVPPVLVQIDTESVIIVHTLYNDTVRRVARETGATLVDLAEHFNRMPSAERTRLFIPGDYIHTNDAGNAVIAQEFDQALRRAAPHLFGRPR